MGRFQLTNTMKQSLAIHAELEYAIILESVCISLDIIKKREQCFHFRGKIECTIYYGVIQWLDTEMVARAKEPVFLFIP